MPGSVIYLNPFWVAVEVVERFPTVPGTVKKVCKPSLLVWLILSSDFKMADKRALSMI